MKTIITMYNSNDFNRHVKVFVPQICEHFLRFIISSIFYSFYLIKNKNHMFYSALHKDKNHNILYIKLKIQQYGSYLCLSYGNNIIIKFIFFYDVLPNLIINNFLSNKI